MVLKNLQNANLYLRLKGRWIISFRRIPFRRMDVSSRVVVDVETFFETIENCFEKMIEHWVPSIWLGSLVGCLRWNSDDTKLEVNAPPKKSKRLDQKIATKTLRSIKLFYLNSITIAIKINPPKSWPSRKSIPYLHETKKTCCNRSVYSKHCIFLLMTCRERLPSR